MSAPKASPKAPPVYRPQPTPKVLQKKASMSPQAVPGARQTPAAPPAYRPQPTAPAAVQAKKAGQNAVQAKTGWQSSNVVQLKKACKVCGHKHGSTDCTTQVWIDPADHSQGKRACGCQSHSSKHGGGKFNPGSGKRARRLAASNMA